MNQLHVDIETLSTKPNALVLQIGAAIRKEPYQVPLLFLASARLELYPKGFNVEQSTVDWWQTQPEEARHSLNINLQSPEGMARLFIDWVNNNTDRNTTVWANPPQFDLTILKHLFDHYDLPCPWHYTKERCTRTIYRDFAHRCPPPVELPGLIKHRADHDALRQLIGVETAYLHLDRALANVFKATLATPETDRQAQS